MMALLLLLTLPLLAQDTVLQRPEVRKALDYLRAHHEDHLASQIRIAEIPAPTFHEAERARYMEKEFRRVGLKDVEIDKQGNVLGWRPGKSSKALVVAAHLDISFAPGVNTKVRKEGSRWFAPGIGDDSRGLAALLAIVEALNDAAIETGKTLLFVANVGEEGLGDLNGVRYLFGQSPHKAKLDSFISIDGTSPARIVNGGTGVKRYRVTLRGPGGHSYGNFGRPSAVHAAALIVSKLAVLPVPAKPKTTYNVGKFTGGTTINAIAEEATLEVDLRSEDPGELDKLELKFLESVRLGVAEENALRKASGVAVKEEHKLVSHRPGGQTAADNALVRAAMWASKATGHTPSLGYSSTDSNLPISLGIPAVTLGGGGRGNNAHSLDEWFEPADAFKGPQMVLLTILAYGQSRIP
ncbi:MAG: M20/M25/M40 family metallo-hydrolase [Bryobacterales bacterium]|nr:M20/M25/M40 family metallo-hydrolase [Bryobacterales bacterium]